MTYRIDTSLCSNKKELLSLFMNYINEFYAPNEDALIDALTGMEENTTIILKNFKIENYPTLIECFEIIQKENSKITIQYK